MPETQDLTESATLLEAADPATGLALIQLITPGWGSRGHYSAQVLSEAATAKVWPAGLHMYLDHPAGDGSGVDADGNRSVRDLAAVLTEDARTDKDGGLVAAARVFGPWRPVLAELKEDIGVSIRARGTAEIGEAEGRRGMIITSIAEGISVDFVVAAGRGGRILELAESARAAAPADAELVEANANDVRAALQTEVDETYGKTDGCYDCGYCWVRDFDPDTGLVYFDVRVGGDCSLYSQPYTLNEDGTAELTGERTEVTAQTVYVTVTAPDPDALGESGTNPLNDAGTPPAPVPPVPIQEDHMTEPTGAGAAPPINPRQVLEQGLAETRRQVAVLQARDRARTVIAESLGSAWLPESTVARLAGELLTDLPMANDTLDEAALRDRATAKRDIAETEMAEALKAAGVGTVQGFGSHSNGGGGGVDQAGLETSLTESFLRMGMTPEAAKIAAKGRV